PPRIPLSFPTRRSSDLLSSSSRSLQQAVSYANKAGVVLVAAAGNESTNARVYPAAMNGNVVGIASTTDWDTRSSFSNYGSADVRSEEHTSELQSRSDLV